MLQGLPRVFCQLDARCCLTRLSGLRLSGLNIVWAFRPLELVEGDDGSASREDEAKDAGDQGSDPVLHLN